MGVRPDLPNQSIYSSDCMKLHIHMPAPTILTIEPLSREAFAPFGDVIQADDAAKHFTINEGNTERYHDLADIDPGADGRAIVSIFRGKPRTLPFTVTMMERHPKASQAFIPVSGRPYLVVVAKADTTPTVGDLRVFLCQGDQGVNYAGGSGITHYWAWMPSRTS